MSLKVSASDGVKVYTVAGGKNIPSWLSDKKQKSLRKDEEYRRRVELVQDFDFPAASQRIKVSPDGQYIFATGYHPPRVRVYDVNQLSMKFERHLDSEIVDFQILTEDYSKAVFLCADRSLHFHARFGGYYKTRVPKFGRDLAYCPFTAELLVASSSPDVYRMNLSEGRFMAPLTSKSPAVNACGLAPAHGLLACAGEDGGLECFDLRQRDSLGWMDAAAAAGSAGHGLTALRFDAGGMHVAVGTSSGLVALFDLRSQRPLVVKDHMYDSKIVDIKFHSGSVDGGQQRVISADKHIIKIWDASTGEGYTNIEPAEGCDINDVAVWKESGLIVAACDAPRIQAYFVPTLGPAPGWCSFLESLTEELEESANPTLYDDYRFITKADLGKLGLTHLVGTPLLRAYMHGFFVDNRLYQKASALADPFAYDAYRQKRVAQKLEDERKSRISLVRKLPKVNATMAAQILVDQAKAAKRQATDIAYHAAQTAAAASNGENAAVGGAIDSSKQKTAGTAAAVPTLLEDDRFKALFEDPEFAIDERSEEFKILHPNVDPNKDRKLLAEHFEELRAPERERLPFEEDNSEDDDKAFSESDGDGGGGNGGQRHQRSKRLREENKLENRLPRMFTARDEAAAAAFREGKSLATAREVPLGMRSKETVGVAPASAQRLGGNREVSFVPRRSPDGGRGGRGRGRGRGTAAGGGRGRGGRRGRGRGGSRR